MKKLWKRYWSPSAKWARKLGDFCLLMIPVLEGLSFSNPLVNDYKNFVFVGLVIIKFVTNFTKSSADEKQN